MVWHDVLQYTGNFWDIFLGFEVRGKDLKASQNDIYRTLHREPDNGYPCNPAYP